MSRLQILFRIALAAAVLALLGFGMCSFQVAGNEGVVHTRFGSPVATHTRPGLYFKWPSPVDAIHRFDTRLAFHDTRLSEALTQDKRNIILPVYLAWRVADPLKFLQSLGSPAAAPAKLDSLATSARNALLGRYDFKDLVTTDPSRLKLGELEERLATAIRPQALESFGIAIEAVGVKRIALPQANTLYVFDRMRAERGQYAARYRAEGRREAEELRAHAEAEKTVVLAEAEKYAEQTLGRAEAESARIYADAHSQEPRFYQLVRELESLRKITRENTTLVVDTDTAPFNQLKAVAPPASSAP